MAFFSDVGNHVFADFYHKNSVVTFSCHGGMSQTDVVSELIDSQIALTSAPLSADGSHSLQIPSVHGFVNAAETQQVIFVALWILEYVFAVSVEQAQSYSAGQKRHQSILLELVVKNRSVTGAFWTQSKSFLCIRNPKVDASSSCSNTHGGNA